MTNLTRICVACSTEKPLAAFLYLTSKAGTAYGNLCATCRGKGIKEKAERLITEDEKSSTTSGLRIGAKQLAEIELQKKREQEERQNKQDEDLKNSEEISLNKSESAELKEKNQKALREKIKVQGFLNYQSKQNLFNASPATLPAAQDKKQQAIEINKKTEAIKQEKQKTTFDINSTQSHHLATRDITLQRLQSLFGSDTPVMKTMSQFYKTVPAGQNNIDAAKQEAPSEFIKRTWGKR